MFGIFAGQGGHFYYPEDIGGRAGAWVKAVRVISVIAYVGCVNILYVSFYFFSKLLIRYVCATYERFDTVSQVLRSLEMICKYAFYLLGY